MIDQQKVEAIAKKQQKNRERSGLSIENNGYYDSKIFADLNQENGLNLLGDDQN